MSYLAALRGKIIYCACISFVLIGGAEAIAQSSVQYAPWNRNSAAASSGTNFTAAWSMDEASGNRVDCKTSLALVPSGTTTQVGGRIAQAIHFAGTTADFAECANVSAIQSGGQPFSVSYWCISDSAVVGANTWIPVAHYGGAGQAGWQIYWTSTHIVFGVSSDGTAYQEVTLVAPIGITTNFVAAVYDGSTIKIYCGLGAGGINSASSSFSAGVHDSTSNFSVGNRATHDATTAFPGAVDELVFYKWALSSGDVTTRYNSGLGRAECSFP